MKSLPVSFTGLALLIYGVYLHLASQEALGLSPGLLPALLGLALMVLSPGLILDFRKDRLPWLEGLIILFYGLSWYFLGARLATLAYTGLALYLLGGEGPLRSLLFALGLVFLVELTFAGIFGIVLP